MAWLGQLTVYEWFLVALLLLTVLLVCVGAGVYYGKRPAYPSTMTVRSVAEDTDAIQLRQSRHSAEDRGMNTQRLGSFPARIYPNGEEIIWREEA